MSERVLFDTTAHVQAFRARKQLPSLFEGSGELVVYFSSVVGQELYMGAVHAEIELRVNRLWYGALEAEMLIVPNPTDWRNAGLLLRDVARRYGSPRVGTGRLTNDALIAISAARNDLTVLSANDADFVLLNEFADFQFRRFDLPA